MNDRIFRRYLAAVITTVVLSGLSHAETTEIALPEGAGAISAIQFLEDGRLALATAEGGIYLAELPEDEAAVPEWQLFSSSGLDRPSGLYPGEPGELFVLQRPELTLLRDQNDDGKADLYRLVNNAWPLLGDARSGATALTVDEGGRWLVALSAGKQLPQPLKRGATDEPAPVSTETLGEMTALRAQASWASATDLVPSAGWVVQLNADGSLTPLVKNAGKIGAIALQTDGELAIVSDLGPDDSPSLHFVALPEPIVVEGEDELADPVPIELPAPSIAMPSALGIDSALGNPVIQTDPTRAFAGQWFIGGAKNGLLRVIPDEVDGAMQGAVTGVFGNEALLRKVSQLRFGGESEAQTLFAGTSDGRLVRFPWPSVTPFCVTGVHLTEVGFEIAVSEELDRTAAVDTASYKVQRLGETEAQPVLVKEAVIEPDGRTVLLKVSPSFLRPGSVYQITATGLRTAEDGTELSHGPLFYTLNRTPPGVETPAWADGQ